MEYLRNVFSHKQIIHRFDDLICITENIEKLKNNKTI